MHALATCSCPHVNENTPYMFFFWYIQYIPTDITDEKLFV